MGNNILAGLMASRSSKSDVTGFPGLGRTKDDETGFSGIFEEKMRGYLNLRNKSYEPQRSFGNKRAEAMNAKPITQSVSSDVEDQASEDGTRAPSAKERPTEEAEFQTKPESRVASEDETGAETEKPEMTPEMASLMGTLLTELDTLLSELSTGELVSKDSMPPGTFADPLEALKAMMGDSLDRLNELMQQIESLQKEAGSETTALLDQIQALLSRMEQVGTKPTSITHTKESVVRDAETCENLIAQIQTQCRHIADKLRSELTDAVGQDQVAEPNESGRLPMDLLETDQAGPKDKTTDGSGQKSAKPKSTEATWVKADAITPDNIDAREGADSTLQNQHTMHTQPPETNPVNLKTDKSVFFLSNKQTNETVTNQVAMKIRLMAGENKQELEMHLKPESLGKLTLKIIHQRGEVLAQMTAENEQVRSILESNMQMLKDSLEKNGFTVQSLDVSVGNQHTGNQSSHAHGQNKRNGPNQPESKSVAVQSMRETVGSDLYGWRMSDDSQQIDLTA